MYILCTRVSVLYTVYTCASSHRFEQRTTEAAKLKLDVDKANETIGAAENLIGKLEGEYKRWSAQVRMYVCIYVQYCMYTCSIIFVFKFQHLHVILY